MSKVELSLSETFHRHKRNLVLLCSAILVLRIASPATLKLPFVGTDDVSLPAQTAFILLGLALIYMFSQFYIEYRTMLARHSSEIVGAPKQTVDEVIDGHIKKMTDWVEISSSVPKIDVNGEVVSLAERLSKEEQENIDIVFMSRYENNLKQTRSRMDIGPNAKNEEPLSLTLNEVKRSIEAALTQLHREKQQTFEGINASLQAIESKQEFAVDKLSEYSASYRSIASEFRRLSSSIGTAQRVGFRWIDGYLVMAFAACSLASCTTGALGWWIKAAAPVAAAVTGK